MGTRHLLHIFLGGQILVVLRVEGGLDGCEFALGRALLDTLELREQDRIARQVHEGADVEDLPAGPSRERGGRRYKTQVGQSKN